MQLAQEHAAQKQEHAPIHEDPLEIDRQAQRKKHPGFVVHLGEGSQEREYHHGAGELDRQCPEVGVVWRVRPADGISPNMRLADRVGGEGLGVDVVLELAPQAVEVWWDSRRIGHARQALVWEPAEIGHHGGDEADHGSWQKEARVSSEDGRRDGRACFLELSAASQREKAVRYGVAGHDEEHTDWSEPRDDESQDGQLIQPPPPRCVWCPCRLNVPREPHYTGVNKHDT